MNLIDKDFLPLSEVSVVEVLDKEAHVLVENLGEVRRAPIKSVGFSDSSAIIKYIVTDSEFLLVEPDEHGILELCQIINEEEIQNRIDNYKKGGMLVLSIDYTSIIEEENSIKFPDGFKTYVDGIGYEQRVVVYEGEDGKVIFSVISEGGVIIVFGWTTSKEVWDKIIELG